MTIRTTLLEARYILGDEALFDQLGARFDHEIVRNSAPEFVAAKLAERDERGAPRRRVALSGRAQRQGRQGRPARSQHAVLDRANTSIGCATPTSSSPPACSRARSCACSSAARNSSGACAAICISSPAAPEERLTLRPAAACSPADSATPRTPALSAVERFMKRYFLVAKDVGDLTAIVCARAGGAPAKPRAMLDRLVGRCAAGRSRATNRPDFASRTTASPSRRRRFRARSRQPDPPVLARRPA